MKYSLIFAAAACLVQAAPVAKEGGLPTPQQYGRAATYHLPKRDAAPTAKEGGLPTPQQYGRAATYHLPKRDTHELYTGEHFKRETSEAPEPEMVYRDVYFAGGFAKRDAGDSTPEVYGKGTPNFGKRDAAEEKGEVYDDIYSAVGFGKRDAIAENPTPEVYGKGTPNFGKRNAGIVTPEAYPHPGLNKKDKIATPEAYPHPGLN